MSIPMRTFQSLLGNNPQPRTEPKLVGPAPMHPTKEDKLNGNDLVMDPHNRIGSPTTSDPVAEGLGKTIKRAASNTVSLTKAMNKGMAKAISDPGFRKKFLTAYGVDMKNMMSMSIRDIGAGSPIQTGDFSATQKRLLSLVDKCNKEDELEYLRKDVGYAKTQMNAWKKGIESGKLQTKCTVKDLEDHEKWLKEIYLKKISEKMKMIKKKEVRENYHGSAEEKLPKDTTGYPTNNEPVLVDTQGIGAVIGVEEGLSVYGNQMILDEIKNVLTGATMEGIDSNLVERFTELYRYQLEHVEEYPDLPVVRQFDHMIRHVVNESVETNDLKLRVMTLQDDLMKGVQKENFEAGFCPNQRNMNELTPMDPTMRMQSYPTYPAEACERSCARLIDNIIFAKDDEELTEAFMVLARMEQLVNEQYSVCEGVIIEGSTSMAARSATRSVTRKISNTSRKVKTSVKKALDPMEKFIENTMTKAKKADSEERRNIILRGGVVPKITRWLKRAIPIAAGLVVGKAIPVAAVLSAIAFLGWIATDKALDHREKAKILKELDDEIEIVNEKIEDARGDSNKQKKYELMRIRNKLNRTRDNVKLNLGSKVVGRLPEDNVVGHNKK